MVVLKPMLTLRDLYTCHPPEKATLAMKNQTLFADHTEVLKRKLR